MSKDLNSCSFIGRLGKDVEMRYTSGGSGVAAFSIACGDDYKDKSGQKVEQTNWINIVVYGKLAEICGKWLTKGSQIYISGKQVTSKWADKDGNDRYSTDIIANDMQMLGGKTDTSHSQQRPNQPSQQYNQANQPSFDDFDDDINDMPF